MAQLALDSGFVAALLYAVFTDLRARRISNRLTYTLIVAGLAYGGITAGPGGLLHSFLGCLLGLGIMFIPFALGAMGAGDVKLMAAIGAIKGPEFVLAAALFASLAGGVLAIVYLIKERRLAATGRYILFGWLWALRGTEARAGAIPYAPAIAVGAIAALAFHPVLPF